MSSYLIKVTWGRWQTDPKWLQSGDIQAAALFDLRFSNNKLSIWKIDDTQSNLDRVIAALSVINKKKTIDNLDYVIITPEEIQTLGLKTEKSPGSTLDTDANKDWHYDIIELSISKIVAIAKCIKSHTIHRKSEPAVHNLVRLSLKNKFIDINDADENLKKQLEALLRKNPE